MGKKYTETVRPTENFTLKKGESIAVAIKKSSGSEQLSQAQGLWDPTGSSTVTTLNGNVTATNTDTVTNSSSLFAATGLQFGQSVTIVTDSATKLTATSTGKKADQARTATGVYANNSLTLGEESKSYMQSIAATATSGSLSGAIGIQSIKGSITFGGSCDAAITVKATGTSTAQSATKAMGIFAGGGGDDCNIYLTGYETTSKGATDIASMKKAITVSAVDSGVSGAKAYGIENSSKNGNIQINKIAAAVTVSATAKAGVAEAHALIADHAKYTGAVVLGQQGWEDIEDPKKVPVTLAKNITATAKNSGTGTAEADCLSNVLGEVTTYGTMAGNLTASATGSKSTGSVQARAIEGKTVKLFSTFKGAVSATASASESTAPDESFYVTVSATGISATSYLDLSHATFEKGLAVKATSAKASAEAYGINVEYGSTLVFGTADNGMLNLGKSTVTASTKSKSNQKALAYGIRSYASINAGAEGETREITGKLTVSASNADVQNANATAFGICCQNDKGATLSLNKFDLTVSAQTVYGIQSTGALDLTLTDSKVTAKSTDKSSAANGRNNSYAIYGSNGSDTIELFGKSTVTGTVCMGSDTGTDTIKIHAGSLINGNIGNTLSPDVIFMRNTVDEVTLCLDDKKSASKALWQGTLLDAANVTLDLDSDTLAGLKSGKTQKFTLLKDTDGGIADYIGGFSLSLDGENSTAIELNGEATMAGDYSCKLTCDAKGKTVQLAVTKV